MRWVILFQDWGTPVTDFIKPNNAPYILGVAGGSGSGKTYFAQELQNLMGHEHCQVISQDNFYIDQSKKFDFDGGSVNFDQDLLAARLDQLKKNQTTEIPIYDFVTHTRKSQTISVQPRTLLIIDGILILHFEKVRQFFNSSLFFATPESLRFSRRLNRDVKERGRSPEGVKRQFETQVKPMHDLFVEPSKEFATSIIAEEGQSSEIVSFYYERLRSRGSNI
jgi:uridine kinase